MMTESDLKKLIPVIKTYCSDMYLSRESAKKSIFTIMVFIGILLGIVIYQFSLIDSLSERLLDAEETINQMEKTTDEDDAEIFTTEMDAIQASLITMSEELSDMDRWSYDEICKLDDRLLEVEIELGFEDENARIPIGAWYRPVEGSLSIDP